MSFPDKSNNNFTRQSLYPRTSCLHARPGTMPCSSPSTQRSTTPNPLMKTSCRHSHQDTMPCPPTSTRSSSTGRIGYSSNSSHSTIVGQSNLRNLSQLSTPHPFSSRSHLSGLHGHPSAAIVGYPSPYISHGHPSAAIVGYPSPHISHGHPSAAIVGYPSPHISHGHPSAATIYPSSHVSADWASGGLIIIQEDYITKDRRRNGPAVFLGFEKSKQMHELFYGKRDPGDRSPAHTACREAREESSNLFNFDHRKISDYVIKKNKYGPRHHYAFIVRVESDSGILSSKFADNQSQLKKVQASHTWLEMGSITRVFIEDIELAIKAGYKSGHLSIKDVNDNVITIKDRDAEFLKLTIDSGLYMTSDIREVKLVVDNTIAKTKSYILK